ncbi:MAG: hypothetical protein Q4G22_05930 [Paracoccus sp. (in: a-proteobacteria)]|uniref:hypothetical protein n=1 Tax=Paracoccus sp. TaxID=267 RepID=UPI0026DF3543|nr:hypothetical protein [Paracoccus sp. (in: a-proteobacteria)]MDO5631362.1 hypothetical protein [Paracoccus sp. (in: a-proteobacteria)]
MAIPQVAAVCGRKKPGMGGVQDLGPRVLGYAALIGTRSAVATRCTAVLSCRTDVVVGQHFQDIYTADFNQKISQIGKPEKGSRWHLCAAAG